MNNNHLRNLLDIAIIASIYIGLTLITYPLSYGAIQLRISEALILLTFFNKRHGIGVVIGVFISNLFNPEGFALIDAVLGTLSTSIAVILIIFTKKKLFLCALYPVLTSFIIVFEIFVISHGAIPLYLIIIGVVGSMAIVELVIGYIVFKILMKNKSFLRLIKCEKEWLIDGIQSSGTKE